MALEPYMQLLTADLLMFTVSQVLRVVQFLTLMSLSGSSTLIKLLYISVERHVFKSKKGSVQTVFKVALNSIQQKY